MGKRKGSVGEYVGRGVYCAREACQKAIRYSPDEVGGETVRRFCSERCRRMRHNENRDPLKPRRRKAVAA